MKIIDILRECDEVRPNPYAPATKLRWIAELDGKAAVQVFLMGIEETQHFNYNIERDLETEPLIKFPHDGIYLYWLNAKMDYAAGELSRYNYDIELFNAAWGEFVRWFAGTYDPVQRGDAEDAVD